MYRYESSKKVEPAQSQAADRFEQRIRQNRQQHKQEMEVRVQRFQSITGHCCVFQVEI